MGKERASGSAGARYEDIHLYMVSLVGIGGKPIRGRTKLQKMFFLLANDEPEIGGQLDYFPYYYGPYSEVLEHEFEYLKSEGIISEDSGRISLTNRGKNMERRVRKEIDESVLDALEEYKEMFNDITNSELLAFIYLTFPDMAVRSVKYERIKERSEPLIMSLVKKDKISSQRAAELLGVTQSRIFHNMNEMGMRVFY